MHLERSPEWYAIRRARRFYRFKLFIYEFRKEKIRLLKKSRIKHIRDYQRICRNFTEFIIQYDSIDTEGRSFEKLHIDHIIPVDHACRMGISPYLIAMSANLQRLTRDENYSKGRKQLLLTQKSTIL